MRPRRPTRKKKEESEAVVGRRKGTAYTYNNSASAEAPQQSEINYAPLSRVDATGGSGTRYAAHAASLFSLPAQSASSQQPRLPLTPERSALPCFNDGGTFAWRPVLLPRDCTFTSGAPPCLWGNFCGVPCAKRYLLEHPTYDSPLQAMHLSRLAPSLFGVPGDVAPAPPTCRLVDRGGDLTVDKYRAESAHTRTNVVSQPFISAIMMMESQPLLPQHGGHPSLPQPHPAQGGTEKKREMEPQKAADSKTTLSAAQREANTAELYELRGLRPPMPSSAAPQLQRGHSVFRERMDAKLGSSIKAVRAAIDTTLPPSAPSSTSGRGAAAAASPAAGRGVRDAGEEAEAAARRALREAIQAPPVPTEHAQASAAPTGAAVAAESAVPQAIATNTGTFIHPIAAAHTEPASTLESTANIPDAPVGIADAEAPKRRKHAEAATPSKRRKVVAPEARAGQMQVHHASTVTADPAPPPRTSAKPTKPRVQRTKVSSSPCLDIDGDALPPPPLAVTSDALPAPPRGAISHRKPAAPNPLSFL